MHGLNIHYIKVDLTRVSIFFLIFQIFSYHFDHLCCECTLSVNSQLNDIILNLIGG